QRKMRNELDSVHFADLEAPLVNNWQAKEIRNGADAREGLYQQIPNSVLWTQTIRRLANGGVTSFVEVGPGAVLTGLLRHTEPNLKGYKFGETADLEKLTQPR
ncbi:MAG TPA: malonyl CoA-acyl carrier protein transacylase, partial [Bryobacteraceae bacterium]|nr:malonyl CoA-acyl carrier protein transacylase [Bryobacteraceae bacterium]